VLALNPVHPSQKIREAFIFVFFVSSWLKKNLNFHRRTAIPQFKTCRDEASAKADPKLKIQNCPSVVAFSSPPILQPPPTNSQYQIY
jgi:hypothetical protein